jgi:hypothetical protein
VNTGRGELRVRGQDGVWVFPLDAEERIAVAGPLGDTVVELRGGEARVLSSPCANQTCVAAGAVHGRGQWIACLPNGVFLTLENAPGNKEEPDELDGATW